MRSLYIYASVIGIASSSIIYLARYYRRYLSKFSTKILYKGGCHCGYVRFQVEAAQHLIVWICNCSICKMKNNFHFIAPLQSFVLIQGTPTEYRFNSKIARHMFCPVCGVQSYYHPRSNPDGVAITLACIDKDCLEGVDIEYKQFDGVNWEGYIHTSGIKALSTK